MGLRPDAPGARPHDPAAAVAIIRCAAGLSQQDLANLVGDWSQSTVSLIESGRRGSLYDIRELLRFADAVDMPRIALLPLILGQPEAAARGSPRHGTGSQEAGVDRRTFGAATAGLLAPLLLPPMRAPDRITTSHLHYLRNYTTRLYQRDQRVGGAALLSQATRQLTRTRLMLDHSEYTPRAGQQLLAAAGDLAVCAGWLAFDSGRLDDARRFYSEALLLAGSAEDTILTVHVLTNLSMLASYTARISGRPGPAREGIRLAHRAAAEARHEPSPRLHALIALREANAASLLGDERTFSSAISRAGRELDRGPHDEDPEWILFTCPAASTQQPWT